MRALTIAVTALLTGCSCGQDYSFSSKDFGEVVIPPAAEEPESIGPYVDFDLAPEGARITMAYYDQSASAVGYGVGLVDEAGEITWTHERVDGYDEGKRGKYVTQATAADGTVWVAYHDEDTDSLKARKRIGGGVWEEPVEIAPGGLWADMAMVGSRPVVVHTDASSGALHLATLVDGAWANASIYQSTDAQITLPDGKPATLPAEVLHPRILLDDGALKVVVHDAAQGQLLYLEGGTEASGSGDFATEVVEGGGVGAWPSMLVHDGDLHVAYHDMEGQVLRLAVREGSNWLRETVDDGALRGADTELFVGADGALNVLYFDGWNADLIHAVDAGGSWQAGVLRGQGSAAGFHNAVGAIGDFRYVGTLDYTTGAYELFQL